MKKLDKIKLIPPFCALLACFITCVISIVQQVDFGIFVKRLAISAIVFLALGFAARIAIWNSFRPEPMEEPEEGEEGDEEDITIEESVVDEDSETGE